MYHIRIDYFDSKLKANQTLYEFDYEEVSLTYYADGVLTDDQDNIIEDVEGLVGLDSLNHFGEYEDDSVYIRDEMNEMDYEILKSEKKFSEIPERGRAN